MEFAIILPVLILIILGIIEFGFILYDRELITNASRVGARIGIVATEDSWSVRKQDIENAIDNYLVPPDSLKTWEQRFLLRSLGSLNYTFQKDVTPDPPSPYPPTPGDTLTVTVAYDYTFLAIPNFIGKQITLTGQTVMRFE